MGSVSCRLEAGSGGAAGWGCSSLGWWQLGSSATAAFKATWPATVGSCRGRCASQLQQLSWVESELVHSLTSLLSFSLSLSPEAAWSCCSTNSSSYLEITLSSQLPWHLAFKLLAFASFPFFFQNGVLGRLLLQVCGSFSRCLRIPIILLQIWTKFWSLLNIWELLHYSILLQPCSTHQLVAF